MTLEEALFVFLDRKYVQRSSREQAAMGLQYMQAETHDLAREVAHFVTILDTMTEAQPDQAVIAL